MPPPIPTHGLEHEHRPLPQERVPQSATPLGPSKKRFLKSTQNKKLRINKKTISLLPHGAIVTNVARGDIVDDDALIEALDSKKVSAVGLDVYKNEPNLNPGYLKHKSAFILPHLGSATKETRTAMANLAIDNIDEFFKTGSCKNKVN